MLIPKLIGVTIRILGGSSYNEGRVEVNYNGEWGTVCDDGWDDTDADVVCRQLGFGSSGTAMGSASFGQGSGPIWLSSIKCSGSEPSITNCVHLGVNITSSCSHFEDAGVICDKQNGRVYKCIIASQCYILNTLFCLRYILQKELDHCSNI